LQKDCPAVEISCSKGCETKLQRGELEEHLSQECPFAPIKCEFADYGCTTSPLRVEYDEHLDECSKQHLTLLSKAFKDQKAELATVKKHLDELKAPKQQECCFQNVIVPFFASVKETIQNCRERCRERCNRASERCDDSNNNNPCSPFGFSGCHLVAVLLLWAFFNLIPGCLKFFLLVGLAAFTVSQKLGRGYCNRRNRNGECGERYRNMGSKARFIIFAALLLSIFNPVSFFLRLFGFGCANYYRHY